MEILHIGPLEIITILILIFVLLGPEEMIKTAQRTGRLIRDVIRSPLWREILGYSKAIRELPQKIISDTGIDDALVEIKEFTDQTTSEINVSLNETIQSARIPEVEHLKIRTTQETPVPKMDIQTRPREETGIHPES